MGTKQTELELLQSKVRELEKVNADLAEQNKRATGGGLEAIRKEARRNRKDASTIRVREFKDYVPIRLYHANGVNIGKVVGPMHPDSAEDAFMRFAAHGITLSINKPTDAEVEAYKQTPEYKSLAVKEKKRRDARSRTRKESEVERLTRAVETLSGHKVVNAIKEQE